jgi:hypothetical protein
MKFEGQKYRTRPNTKKEPKKKNSKKKKLEAVIVEKKSLHALNTKACKVTNQSISDHTTFRANPTFFFLTSCLNARKTLENTSTTRTKHNLTQVITRMRLQTEKVLKKKKKKGKGEKS